MYLFSPLADGADAAPPLPLGPHRRSAPGCRSPRPPATNRLSAPASGRGRLQSTVSWAGGSGRRWGGSGPGRGGGEGVGRRRTLGGRTGWGREGPWGRTGVGSGGRGKGAGQLSWRLGPAAGEGAEGEADSGGRGPRSVGVGAWGHHRRWTTRLRQNEPIEEREALKFLGNDYSNFARRTTHPPGRAGAPGWGSRTQRPGPPPRRGPALSYRRETPAACGTRRGAHWRGSRPRLGARLRVLSAERAEATPGAGPRRPARAPAPAEARPTIVPAGRPEEAVQGLRRPPRQRVCSTRPESLRLGLGGRDTDLPPRVRGLRGGPGRRFLCLPRVVETRLLARRGGVAGAESSLATRRRRRPGASRRRQRRCTPSVIPSLTLHLILIYR